MVALMELEVWPVNFDLDMRTSRRVVSNQIDSLDSKSISQESIFQRRGSRQQRTEESLKLRKLWSPKGTLRTARNQSEF